MKTKNAKMLLSAAILLLMAWGFASCGSDDDNNNTVVNKTSLKTSLDTANHYLSVAVEGTAAGQYAAGSKTTLQSVTTAAQAIYDNASSTQAQVTATTSTLNDAITTFKAGVVSPVDPSNLIAYWKFDEGSGSTTADASGNSHTAAFFAAQSAAVGTGGAPTWVVDRKGVAGKALHFTDGGHLEVPKSTAFNPAAITISLWANLDSLNTANGIFSGNYMISQNDYNVWKFQTQEAKKPFFTQKTTTKIYDKDTENGLAGNNVIKLKKWYHLAVTYVDGTETFYVNGQAVKTWTDVTGAMATEANLLDLCIGVNLPNATFAANPPDYNVPRFFGSMDEIRLYKVALSAAQIAAIYSQEK